ncbi:hypothetical protein [Lactovum odontotermitis]
MKKRTIIIIVSIFIPILIIVGIIGGFKMNEQQTKDRQVTFLKAHEQELTEYIKSKNNTIISVTYDWNSANITDGGAFTEQEISIDFDVNNAEQQDFDGGNLGVSVNDVNNPTEIKRISVPANLGE